MSAAPSRRICLTGPASEQAAKRWMDAVYTVPGWTPIHMPLVRIVGVGIRSADIPILPGLIAVTSQNALPALKKLWDERMDVREAPHAAVGLATARAMRALGVDPIIVGDSDESGAAQLAERIVEATRQGQMVIWPRGDRANDLRERLVLAGRLVNDPIAYRTEDIEGTVLPGHLDSVFFASPSAVKVWVGTSGAPRVTAFAIGQTTQAEIAPEYARFKTIVRLARPTPKALADALEAL